MPGVCASGILRRFCFQPIQPLFLSSPGPSVTGPKKFSHLADLRATYRRIAVLIVLLLLGGIIGDRRGREASPYSYFPARNLLLARPTAHCWALLSHERQRVVRRRNRHFAPGKLARQLAADSAQRPKNSWRERRPFVITPSNTAWPLP
jgi:hypothetical protein